MRTQLTDDERKYFINEIKRLVPDLPHEIADVDKTALFWEDKYNSDNGILGSFDLKHPHSINLSPLGKQMPEMLVSTVAHELHHKWQFETLSIFYFFMAIPGIRQCLLEPTAKEVELAVDKLLGLEDIN